MANATQLEVDFGPLKELVNDDSISYIMVNGPDQVYVEQHQERRRWRRAEVTFRDSEHVIEVINDLLASINPNVQVSADCPHADVRFPNGMRMQAIVPPIAVSGPSLAIRKAPRHRLTLDHFLDWGTLDEDMAGFLTACVKARLNIVIAGGVGSGKTTLLQVLTSAIPAEERIVTVEKEAELRPDQKHVVALERRPPNQEGRGEISIRDLLQMISRMKPDRILIGDLTGSEVLEALRLMDEGYDGTMATISAHSPREALERLEMLVKMNDPNLPVSYLRSLISSAVDLVVQQNRLEDGSRKVVRVTEILPMRGGDYDLHDVFVFQREGFESGRVTGHFESYPASLGLMRRMEAYGITLPPSFLTVMEEEQETQ